jgi:hypothetical protein
MANLLEDQNVISPERWRAWEARDRAHDRAFARKIILAAIGVLALAGAFYALVVR